jgi:signal peptidase I
VLLDVVDWLARESERLAQEVGSLRAQMKQGRSMLLERLQATALTGETPPREVLEQQREQSAAARGHLGHAASPARAIVQHEQKARASARWLAWQVAQPILLTMGLFLVLSLLVQPYQVDGGSMEPTLQSGQYLLVNKVGYWWVDAATVAPWRSTGPATGFLWGGPQRGDIAVVHAPTAPGASLVKRIIGLPGDTVLVADGLVFVNGQQLDEPYVESSDTYTYPDDGQPVRVPDSSYFVLGDNRPGSVDSHLGWFVSREELVGRAWLSYWPPAVIGLVPGQAPVQHAGPGRLRS